MATANGAALDLGGFIRTCIERAGGAVEDRAPGRLDALLPPVLEAAAGGRGWVSLALANEAADGSTEVATLGSPFADALIAHATARGTVAVGYLPVGRLKRKGLRDEAERTLRFSNCRTHYLEDEAELLLAGTAQFDFKVAFISEDRRERLYVVPVNLFSGHVDPGLSMRLSEWTVEDESNVTLPEAPQVAMEAAYDSAREALRSVVMEEATRQQARVVRRFSVEFMRIRDYYARAIEELERRRDRERRANASAAVEAGRSDPTDDARFDGGRPTGDDGFAHRIEAVRDERERKLRELGEAYGIRTRAQLAGTRLLWQPKVFFKVMVDRGPLTRKLTLVYDGLQGRLEPPGCESCRRPTTRLRVAATARLLCPDCAESERSTGHE